MLEEYTVIQQAAQMMNFVLLLLLRHMYMFTSLNHSRINEVSSMAHRLRNLFSCMTNTWKSLAAAATLLSTLFYDLV